MAKQTVNLGSSANDGTGDPLRTAFDKINDNFDELYLYSTAATGNNITITANTIASDNTNGNIILDPNGTGDIVVATGAELTLTDHTDNAVLFSDASGNLTMSAGFTFDGTNVATTGSISVNSRLKLEDNRITTQTTNDDIDVDPSGTGAVNILANTAITGNITVSGQTVLNGSFRPAMHTFTATDAVTSEEHAGRTLLLGDVGGDTLVTLTLPAATGTGDIYKFIVSVVNTSNYVIKVADATDTIDGQVIVQNDTTEGGTASVIGWKADGTDDTITLNGTTTGGASIGDYVELIDIAANQYTVSGMLQASGTEATPFSATVS